MNRPSNRSWHPMAAVIALAVMALACGRTNVTSFETDPLATEICDNGRDDDADGLVDCNDPECRGAPHCGAEDCGNTADDDADGLVDCDDPECIGDPGCGTDFERCANRLDDDGDGAVDCDDVDCATDPACQLSSENCTNARDDDGDMQIDCDDSDCSRHAACRGNRENCTNKQDDDRDGLFDCSDPDCFKHPDCKQPGIEVCNNNLDDDEDTRVDCDDSDCSALPICAPGSEICDNTIDDDGDGATDCDDPDCVDQPGCKTLLCQPTIDFGTIKPKGSSVTRTMQTVGAQDVYRSGCAVPGGGEAIARFVLSDKTDLRLIYSQTAGDHVFSIYRAGVAEACNANPCGCFDPESEPKGEFSVKALPAGEYYLFVEAFAKGLEGSTQITLSSGTQPATENCLNGIDDDGDGATDCADVECTARPECASQACTWDQNLGSLVVNGPSRSAQINTQGGGNEIEEKCAAGGGQDRVLRFVMPEAGGLSVQVEQNGWHTFGLHKDLGPGTVCTADTGSCFDSNSKQSFHLAYGSLDKGVYYYVVDALKPGSEGPLKLTFRAFGNRGPELCANKIDDDGDGLSDCKDPDCTGVVGCPGPVCKADHKAGPLLPGSPGVALAVNTTTSNNDQTVPCALGGGKDPVIELELTKVSGLQITCSQSGDHVLGLFAAGKPRDPCDKVSTNCADLKTGPMGCSFIFPNLQPGKYYLVVEAFKPGAEGKVNIDLTATPDHAQEICNNNVDDDGDGKIDCQDSNCSAKPICSGQTCTPDQKAGVIPIGGAKKDVGVTTSGAGDSNSAGCALGGGEDSVVSFKMPKAGSLSIDYAQFGNHVMALYRDKGVGFACDAVPVACRATNNTSVGSIAFAGLSAGDYYLVIEATAQGSEGSVVMRLSGK